MRMRYDQDSGLQMIEFSAKALGRRADSELFTVESNSDMAYRLLECIMYVNYNFGQLLQNLDEQHMERQISRCKVPFCNALSPPIRPIASQNASSAGHLPTAHGVRMQAWRS